MILDEHADFGKQMELFINDGPDAAIAAAANTAGEPPEGNDPVEDAVQLQLEWERQAATN